MLDQRLRVFAIDRQPLFACLSEYRNRTIACLSEELEFGTRWAIDCPTFSPRIIDSLTTKEPV